MKKAKLSFLRNTKKSTKPKKRVREKKQGGRAGIRFFFLRKESLAVVLDLKKIWFVHIGQFDHISRFETLFAIALTEAECKNAKQLWKPMKINKK